MGGRGSGTPPAREQIDEAARLVEGGMSHRAAALQVGVSRDCLRKYRKKEMYRRLAQRCPTCGAVVRMPCQACSIEVQAEAAKRKRKRRATVARKRMAG